MVETFAQKDIDAVANHIAELESKLDTTQKRLLAILLASANITVIIDNEETIGNVDPNILDAARRCLSRFKDKECFPTIEQPKPDIQYAWKR
jgi:hypothetical protein